MLSQFGKHARRAREWYARFVAEGVGEGHREEFHRGSVPATILRDDRLSEAAMARAGRPEKRRVALEEVLEFVPESVDDLRRNQWSVWAGIPILRSCAPKCLSEQELAAPGKRRPASHARALLAWLVRQLPELSLQESANRLGRDLSSLSAAATRLEQRVAQDGEIQRQADQLRARF